MTINTHPASILPFGAIFTLGSDPLFYLASNGTGLAFVAICFLDKEILIVATEIFPRLHIGKVDTVTWLRASANKLVIIIVVIILGTRANS